MPKKIRVFVGMVIQNGLQMNEKRWRCHIAALFARSRCSALVEDMLHCLRDCPHFMEVCNRLGTLAWSNFRCDNTWVWINGGARGVNG